jgi:hypothetical protein
MLLSAFKWPASALDTGLFLAVSALRLERAISISLASATKHAKKSDVATQADCNMKAPICRDRRAIIIARIHVHATQAQFP